MHRDHLIRATALCVWARIDLRAFAKWIRPRRAKPLEFSRKSQADTDMLDP